MHHHLFKGTHTKRWNKPKTTKEPPTLFAKPTI